MWMRLRSRDLSARKCLCHAGERMASACKDARGVPGYSHSWSSIPDPIYIYMYIYMYIYIYIYIHVGRPCQYSRTLGSMMGYTFRKSK